MNIHNTTILIGILSITMMSALTAAVAPSGDILELIDVTRLPYLRDSQSMLTSSYDRTGGNDDGFSGAYSFIRKEDGNSVIFDEKGPGCIQRIWSAKGCYDTSEVWFYLDGSKTPTIKLPSMKALFDGSMPPFAAPVSGIKLGGGYTYMPIPFAKSCKIVVKGKVTFYQISWQKFPAERVVKTFSMKTSAADKKKLDRVKQVWMNPGRMPWPVAKNAQTIKVSRSIKPGGRLALTDIEGAGIIRSLKIKASCADDRMFRRALLESYVDGMKKPTIWSPLGDFFLDGFGQKISNSMMLGRKDGVYYCYFPMPFKSNMLMSIANNAMASLSVEVEIIWEPLKTLLPGMGYFNAWWHRQNPTIDRELFPILDAEGRGHWCGVSHAMQGNGGLGFLEGDDMAWIDGRDNSSYNGTGTEDYFNGGWYFGETGNTPLSGCGVYDDGASKCLAFRIMLTDGVSFTKKTHIGIEHGPISDIEADYAGVTYWYADAKTTHRFDVVSEDSRLPRPTRAVRDSIECEETVYYLGNGVSIIDDKNLPFTLSNGKAVVFPSENIRDPYEFSFDVNCSGFYSIEARFIGSPQGCLAQAYIDSKKIGNPFTTLAKKMMVLPIIKFTNIPWLEKGKHGITFKIIQQDVEPCKLISDYLRLSDAGTPIEGEQMKVLRSSGEPLSMQDLKPFGTGWSNQAQLFFMAKSAGAYYDLELPVKADGWYSISAYMTKAPDYGIVRVKLDGAPIGDPFDGFAPGVARSGRIQLDETHLSAGAHTLTFEVTGKNPQATGFFTGLDCVILDKKR
ncbi:MAG: glycoside hydrolase family 172 protein [Armatimonadota bacterium]